MTRPAAQVCGLRAGAAGRLLGRKGAAAATLSPCTHLTAFQQKQALRRRGISPPYPGWKAGARLLKSSANPLFLLEGGKEGLKIPLVACAGRPAFPLQHLNRKPAQHTRGFSFICTNAMTTIIPMNLGSLA
jgi:hypothetical protein